MLNHFVIASIQRSGTTLLSRLLASHSELSSNRELLKNARFQRKDGIRLIESLPHDDNCLAIGFKLMLNQIDVNKWVMEYLANKSYKVILLRRESLFDIYLSHQIAKRDNRWSVNRKVEVEPIFIDLDDMEKQLTLFLDNQRRLNNIFMNFDIFNISYSNLNKEIYHSKLLKFLNVDNSVKLSCDQKKVLRKPRTNYITNYDEVLLKLESLKDSGGPVCLDN